MERTEQALVFDIKRDSSEDGPGIRTTIFFKGCPLSCVWCQNPEGVDANPEILTDGESVGYWITLEELLYRIVIDKPFFNSSGGGVTLSGGEPTLQMAFIHRLLKALKKEGIQTAIQTCGLFNYERFRKQVLPWLDLIYFDLKLIDDSASKIYTGCTNRSILKNFTHLASEAGIPVIPRIPLIPDITSTERNLSGLARFLYERGVVDCTLIPYNPLWQDKLERLGKKVEYRRRSFLTPEEQDACVGYFRQPL